MTAYEILHKIDSTESLMVGDFYSLINSFQETYLQDKQYNEKVVLHRNPIEVKNETLNELYSYLLRIQGREEMRDIDLEKNVYGYVPSKIIDIWRSDKTIKLLYQATAKYCELTGKNFTIIAVHIAEYRAMNKLVSRIRLSIQKDRVKEPQISKAKEAKKKRVKIPQENKVRAGLQKEINSTCPFCENQEVGHFQIHHIDDNPANNIPSNLLLLCPNCHSKITKGDISQAEVIKIKEELEKKSLTTEKRESTTINFSSRVDTAIVGNNNRITIKQSSKKGKYPPDCIGFETIKGNYVGYLIDQYNKYKKYELGEEKISYSVFAKHLKAKYKIAPTRTIYNLPLDKFEDITQYIQLRINNTKLAKIKGKNHKNYSSFEDYLKQVST